MLGVGNNGRWEYSKTNSVMLTQLYSFAKTHCMTLIGVKFVVYKLHLTKGHLRWEETTSGF